MGKTKRRIFPVKGMGCAACVARVEGALKSHPGVQDVSVSLASSSARVDYDGSACTPEDLQKVTKPKMVFMSCGSKENPEGVKKSAESLRDAGYNAHSFVSEGTAHEFLTWRRSLKEMAPMLFK